jgi:hypothetical protein
MRADRHRFNDSDFRLWHIASFRGDADFGRYRGKADIGQAAARQIYGFTAKYGHSQPGIRTPVFSRNPQRPRSALSQ